MAAPAKSTRWGSFLQQAVAGVEARLDNMLAEGENGAIQSETPQPTTASTTALSKDHQISQPRSSTSSRTNDRLQERLAKAIAAKNTQPSDARSLISDSQSTRPSADGGRPAVGMVPKRVADAPILESTSAPAAAAAAAIPNDTLQGEDEVIETSRVEPLDSQRLPNAVQNSPDWKAQQADNFAISDQRPELGTATMSTGHRVDCKQCTALRAQVEVLEVKAEQSAKEQQEEIHRYVEQFESIQAKLQFLARDATDAARTSAAAAPAGSHERMLAERDIKITALMNEGRNLAATEQKHRTIIRKLRAQIADDEKTLGELRTRQEKLTADTEALRPRANRVEELEQTNQELQIKSNGMQDELSALRDEVSTNKSTMQRLRDDLRSASDQANFAIGRANEEALTAEKRRVKDLEDTVAALQLERSLIAGRAKESAAEAEEEAARIAERTRTKELEMKAELQAMEGKLEAMRALAEEASSGAVGDSQVKLLRQVETLQTQHAIAVENWQGIEASLIARVGNLERERDDALRRESDMRKKARETATRCKRQDEELQELTSKFPNYQRDIESFQARNEVLQKRAENAEAALSHARLDLEKQQTAWKTETTEPDRRPWLEDHLPGPGSRIQSRPDSPLLSVPTRTMSNDLLLLHSVSGKSRKISTPTSGTDGHPEGSQLGIGRRLPSQTPARPPILSGGSNQPVAPSITSFELPPDSLPTPTSYPGDKDDLFDGVETASLPRQMMQDMVSVSTVGAGPSVQLVERMSAAIRRLEAEKVTSREELARISGQRDEARAEIVSLMKDLESSKTASKRVAELEGQVEDLNSRYQTTLELLGEKSELVEELRADVQDVKAMYRDLVERTIR
ncbi:M protein repeat protein [Colletotrichum orchidophilum]|uniref:M protein repeat protein n=1 Tax=Colletotrichum orchidophilum TaxID=1209926 RepID=A0A1G4ARN9_9PEZI|nr:M protein repeat protein [Colletotrichum orchidophilum]OHE91771.1 M protein repeat protein [Colletotrichum orchidophilum]